MRNLFLHLFITLCTIILIITPNEGSEMATMEYEAIYQFGDSLSDTGNVIRERNGHGLSYARLPYGRTFFRRATGRCSDGLLMVDYFGMLCVLCFFLNLLCKGK